MLVVFAVVISSEIVLVLVVAAITLSFLLLLLLLPLLLLSLLLLLMLLLLQQLKKVSRSEKNTHRLTLFIPNLQPIPIHLRDCIYDVVSDPQVGDYLIFFDDDNGLPNPNGPILTSSPHIRFNQKVCDLEQAIRECEAF